MRGPCGRIFASSHINNTNHYFSEPPEVIKISQDYYQLLLPTIFNPQQKIEKNLLQQWKMSIVKGSNFHVFPNEVIHLTL